MSVLTPESLTTYAEPLGASRANAYPLAGTYAKLIGGLPVFSAKYCTAKAPYIENAETPVVEKETIELLIKYKVVNPEGAAKNEVGLPGCVQQGKATFNGEESQFPHVVYKP